ncbi:MAG: UDP-2,3-diacylglucosamine diphosphatase [Legionellales bacterium]|nr:UDP-2,3-diacylglucosamine diphosphatase [Legionellales bacterium]
MATYFISDLHLDESRPEITELFLHFLTHRLLDADALYILGDLFEVWIGDDEQTSLQQVIAKALKKLTIPVFFIHGNRDFLMGKRYAKQAGLTLLPDPACVTIYGKKILLMHGDLLCTNDIAYQRFRRKVRNPLIQWFFLRTSLRYRLKIAKHYREGSKAHTATKTLEIMDVTPQTVIDYLQRYQVTLLIHGHTHRPAIHSIALAGTEAQRIVLADWHQRGQAIVLYPDHSVENQSVEVCTPNTFEKIAKVSTPEV